MANLKSYISLGFGLLCILFSQVLAHKVPQELIPISNVVLDDNTKDFMKIAEFEKSRGMTNIMIPRGISSDSENDKVFDRIPRGTIPTAATGTIKKNFIIPAVIAEQDYVDAPPEEFDSTLE